MIYKLPTQGRADRPYRGSYPHSVAMACYARGCLHVELNNGWRFVAQPSDCVERSLRFLGRDFDELFAMSPHDVTPMSLVDYVGVATAIALARKLRGQRRG